MSAAENTQFDIERENRRRRSRCRESLAGSDELGLDGCLCFSDSDDQSCHSAFRSTAGGSIDDECRLSGESVSEIEGVSEFDQSSVLSDCGLDVDLEVGLFEIKACLARVEKDCRICHLSLASGHDQEAGVAIELGCCCKGDLAAAHKQCAEKWFKIKGDTTCEICGATAHNVGGELTEEATNTAAVEEAAAAPAAPVLPAETRSFQHGRRVMNFLLACVIFAFIVSWLFHYHVLS